MFARRTPLTDRRALSATVATGIGVVAFSIVMAATAASASAATLKTVSLTVNNTTQTVDTTATTVKGVLTEHDVSTDSNDTVSPTLSTSVAQGMDIDVTIRHEVTVQQGDTATTLLVEAPRVADLKAELSIPTFSQLRIQRFEDRFWKRLRVFTPAGTRLYDNDKLTEGALVRVQQVAVRFPVEKRSVKHRVNKDRTPLLHSGTKYVAREGRDGVRGLRAKNVRVDRSLVSSSIVQRFWVREPRKRVVRIGTGPNWYGLAKCESGNNPKAVNPSGFYGLYQFSLSTWRGVGGKGNPIDHGRWEQTKRAWKLYKVSGSHPWPHCGRYL